jgi:putative colanic acid biosynthesis acetyltransferase WcaF
MAPQSVVPPFSETAPRTVASEFAVSRPVQDLAAFQVPAHFRGRPAWFVQLWWVVHATLFRWSPQVFFCWRRFLVRLFGGTVGKGVLIRPTANITYPWKVSIGNFSWIGDDVTLYSLGEIQIGNNVVISQRSYLCTGSHEMESPAFEITARPIVIEDEAWIATDVFVSPGVRVGHGAVVGVRSTVLQDLPPMLVYVGTPAKSIRPRLAHES